MKNFYMIIGIVIILVITIIIAIYIPDNSINLLLSHKPRENIPKSNFQFRSDEGYWLANEADVHSNVINDGIQNCPYGFSDIDNFFRKFSHTFDPDGGYITEEMLDTIDSDHKMRNIIHNFFVAQLEPVFRTELDQMIQGLYFASCYYRTDTSSGTNLLFKRKHTDWFASFNDINFNNGIENNDKLKVLNLIKSKVLNN